MLGQPIGSLEDTGKVVTASPETSVAEAAGLMLAHGVSAVLAVDDGAIAGIFTEHDVVARVIAAGRDPRSTRLREVMTPEPLTIGPESTLGHALVLMHERGIRHLPVVAHGKPIGIVRARDALDPELEDFIAEVRRRDSFR
jgi:CBS domain-containing protein